MPFTRGDSIEAPVGRAGHRGSSAGGYVACCSAQDRELAGDPGVAANVLVTVTSTPFEVYT